MATQLTSNFPGTRVPVPPDHAANDADRGPNDQIEYENEGADQAQNKFGTIKFPAFVVLPIQKTIGASFNNEAHMATQLTSNFPGTRVPHLPRNIDPAISRGPKRGAARIGTAANGNAGFRALAGSFASDDVDAPSVNPGQAGYGETAPPNETYLDRPAAAKYLHVQPNTLAAWACSKRVKLAYSKLGRRVVYRKVDLDAFVAANMEGGV